MEKTDQTPPIDWERLANEGSKLGAYMYALELEAEAKHYEAFKYYLAAALQNFSPAQNNLGWLYRIGQGTEKNTSAAYSWFYHSAIQGNVLAIHNLGEMFLNGDGVTQNLSLAEDLFLYGAAFQLQSEPESQEGMNWAIQQCRREVAWLHLREPNAEKSNSGAAYLWLRVALMEMEAIEGNDPQKHQQESQELNQLLEQLLPRMSAKQLSFCDHCIEHWQEESFHFRDRLGFPLTGHPYCKDEWLTQAEPSANQTLN